MITHDARRSLSRGNNPVPSPWLATGLLGLLRLLGRLVVAFPARFRRRVRICARPRSLPGVLRLRHIAATLS